MQPFIKKSFLHVIKISFSLIACLFFHKNFGMYKQISAVIYAHNELDKAREKGLPINQKVYAEIQQFISTQCRNNKWKAIEKSTLDKIIKMTLKPLRQNAKNNDPFFTKESALMYAFSKGESLHKKYQLLYRTCIASSIDDAFANPRQSIAKKDLKKIIDTIADTFITNTNGELRKLKLYKITAIDFVKDIDGIRYFAPHEIHKEELQRVAENIAQSITLECQKNSTEFITIAQLIRIIKNSIALNIKLTSEKAQKAEKTKTKNYQFNPFEEIYSSGFKKSALTYHPDKNKELWAEEKFKALSIAKKLQKNNNSCFEFIIKNEKLTDLTYIFNKLEKSSNEKELADLKTLHSILTQINK